MDEHILDLPSAHGDQTLAATHYVIHEVQSSLDPSVLPEAELRFNEGDAVASTNLAHGFKSGSETVGLVVVETPGDYHLGYAAFTSARIDRTNKTITGHPLAYAAGRERLGWYLDADTEGDRKRIEGETTGGYTQDQRPSYVITQEHIVGYWPRSDSLMAVLAQLGVSARTFEFQNYGSYEIHLAEAFRHAEPAREVQVSSMVRALIMGTVEAAVISYLRLMRWQGLQLAGYTLSEGNQVATLTAIDRTTFQNELSLLETRLAAKPFDRELAWLNQYATTQLAIIKVEQNG